MEIAKIIVGVDFSEQAEVAARQAIQIARHTGARVILAYASQMPEGAVESPPRNEAAKEFRRVVDARVAANRARLREMSERLGADFADISHMMIDGFADVGLCEAGRQQSADLVVLGTHGRTGLSHFLLGSVAERVVRHFEGNVMVARPGPSTDGQFRRILVPTDFSANAEDALRLALVLAAPGGTLDLFHAWDTPPEIAMEWSGPIVDELASSASDSGQKLLDRYARSELTVGFESVRGRPAASIQSQLEKHDYDLVIMGSHGRRGLARFLLGSVAEKTVRHASCSVIVTHRQD